MENAAENNSDISTDDLPTAAVIVALQQLLDAKFPLQKYSYELHKATEKGDNYIGVVYRVTVNLCSELNTSSDSSFSLILKVPPRNLTRRKQFFARPCFLRESLAYEKFLPLVAEFQRNKGVVASEQFREYAACYGCLQDELNEAIFMEDLRPQQFELFDRFDAIGSEHVALVMGVYAKLHAVSFAIKAQQPDRLHQFHDIFDIFEQRRNDVALCAYFEELKVSALSTLDAARDRHYVTVLELYFARASFMEMLLALIDGKRCEPYAVVCHGDCWNNNILFKHEHGAPIDARLIDWQLLRYASPVTDLMYFLFTCTTGEFRRAHYESMLAMYHVQLSAHIARLGSDPLKVFPRAAFDDQLKRVGAVGLLFAMILLPIATMKGEDAPNLEALSARIEAGETTDLKGAGLLGASNVNAYSKRMRDAVLDCIDFGYF